MSARDERAGHKRSERERGQLAGAQTTYSKSISLDVSAASFSKQNEYSPTWAPASGIISTQRVRTALPRVRPRPTLLPVRM